MNALEAAFLKLGFSVEAGDVRVSTYPPVDKVRAAIAAYFREMVVSEAMESAGFGECCGFWPDEQCKEFMPEILKAALRAHADELEKEKP